MAEMKQTRTKCDTLGRYAFWGSVWVWVALPAYNGFLAPDAVRQRVVLNSFLGLMGSSGVSYVCSYALYVAIVFLLYVAIVFLLYVAILVLLYVAIVFLFVFP
jgi:hypothetical protein